MQGACNVFLLTRVHTIFPIKLCLVPVIYHTDPAWLSFTPERLLIEGYAALYTTLV